MSWLKGRYLWPPSTKPSRECLAPSLLAAAHCSNSLGGGGVCKLFFSTQPSPPNKRPRRPLPRGLTALRLFRTADRHYPFPGSWLMSLCNRVDSGGSESYPDRMRIRWIFHQNVNKDFFNFKYRTSSFQDTMRLKICPSLEVQGVFILLLFEAIVPKAISQRKQRKGLAAKCLK